VVVRAPVPIVPEKKKKQKKLKKIQVETPVEEVDDGLTYMERKRLKKSARNKIKREAYKRNKASRDNAPVANVAATEEVKVEEPKEEEKEVAPVATEAPGKIEEEFTTVSTKVFISNALP
jgi:hypothetical protein